MTMRRVGRSFCTDLNVAEQREWIVTNGRGGYAMGTIAGTLTRRYHGLLIAALDPPVGRRMIVPSIQLEAIVAGVSYSLATNRWGSGVRAPQGWQYIESFALADGVPTWTYALGESLLEVAVAMSLDRDETGLALRLIRAPGPVSMTMRVLAGDRDHHGGQLPEPGRFAIVVDGDRATVALPDCGRTLHVLATDCELRSIGERWSDFFAEREAERGLDPHDDYVHVLDAERTLMPGDRGGIVVGLEPPTSSAPDIIDAAMQRGASIAAAAQTPLLGELALAAEQFLISARSGGSPRTTVIAGYPWFTDWGRDSMIALPGLALARGRIEVAEVVLRAFAPFVDHGMLPNVFPDGGTAPEYNTVDAALWYVEAIRACAAETADSRFAHDLFPVLESIVAHYTAGTRYGIAVDPRDGLLRAGEAGVQLTWMDAKVDDWVVTPRIGKPVEINALWFAALKTTAMFAEDCGTDSTPYERAAAAVHAAFDRFWNDAAKCCFDVIDGPDGSNPAIRPNQLFVVAFTPELLSAERARAVVDECARSLLTPVGMRTLAPTDPAYVGRYRGDRRSRDGAYHQGTVWPWLLGTFVRAHFNVYADRSAARRFLDPLVDALDGYAIGTLGEIFDGDAPHAPCGTIAQAWSVGELIAVLHLLAG